MPRRILIVDDEATVRYVLLRTVQRHGHDCKEAASGEEALKLLETWSCDLILADLIMSPIDGLMLVRKLRSAGDVTPIIIMTGRVTDELAAEQASLKIAAILSKPCTVPEMDEAINAALGVPAPAA